jgi:hypothetical protein
MGNKVKTNDGASYKILEVLSGTKSLSMALTHRGQCR